MVACGRVPPGHACTCDSARYSHRVENTKRIAYREPIVPKVRNAATVSSAFSIPPETLDALGVLDATLAIDTRLFIDPLLLKASVHKEFRVDATKQYRTHFATAVKLLTASKVREDVAWRSARRQLKFYEIPGTCLGYGAGSILGSAFGPELTERIVAVGKEIVDLGIIDPDLFPSLALFEEGIGSDRISDMTSTVIRKALIKFNLRILETLGLQGQTFKLHRELDDEGVFLKNPTQNHATPVVLVPTDILRPLPIAGDWDEIVSAASRNSSLRRRVNTHIGQILQRKSKRDKAKLREQAMASAAAFQTLLDAVHEVPPLPYDAQADSEGLVRWARVASEFAKQFPLRLRAPKNGDLDSAQAIVSEIIDRYRQMIEQNGLSKELYRENRKPRHESTAQRLFFAVAKSYCEANNLDLSPEVDSGSGHVDFKFSQGFGCRVLVEVKLSTNSKLIAGYVKQLEAYKAAEETMRAFYLVIKVGPLGRKEKQLYDLRNSSKACGEPLSELEFVNGIVRRSASHL